MNESDTRLHKIDPKLKAAGWGVTEGSRITTEYTFTRGKISQTQKGKPKRADYVLVYKGVKLAIVEAKSDELSYAEGVPQAKEYADMLGIRFAYATTPIECKERAQRIEGYARSLPDVQRQFVLYLTNAYIVSGVDELSMNKLKTLLELKFGSLPEGINALGGVPIARQTFKDFQHRLYLTTAQSVIRLKIGPTFRCFRILFRNS